MRLHEFSLFVAVLLKEYLYQIYFETNPSSAVLFNLSKKMAVAVTLIKSFIKIGFLAITRVDGHCNGLFVRISSNQITIQAFFVVRASNFNAENVDHWMLLSWSVDSTGCLQLCRNVRNRIAVGATISNVQWTVEDQIVALRLQVQTGRMLKVKEKDSWSLLVFVSGISMLVPGDLLIPYFSTAQSKSVSQLIWHWINYCELTSPQDQAMCIQDLLLLPEPFLLKPRHQPGRRRRQQSS